MVDEEDNQRPSASSRLAGIPYQWVAMTVVLLGTFMVVLDTTIVNLGLPSLQEDFDAVHGVEWVVTAYLIAVGVTQLASGWAGDRFGRRRAFIFAIVVFTAASLLCAVSPTLWLLVIARVLQGVGGGLLMPVGMAMIYELFDPDERGRALGIFGIAVMAAPAIGPVLGGTLVSSIGWRWLFLINLPVGLVAIPVAIRFLRDTGYREERPLDRGGLAVAAAGLVALLIGLQQGGSWGWTSPGIIALLTTGGVLVTAFTIHSLRVPAPLVDMRIFGHPVFAISMLAIALMTVAQYCRLVYIPLELGATRGVDELKIGLVMLPSAIGVAMMMPIGGRLADRVGSRLPFTVGAAILFVSYIPLTNLTADTDLWKIALILLLGGFGTGLAVMAPNVVAMNAVTAAQVGQASGLSQVSRQVSAALGTAVLASIFVSAAPPSGIADPSSIDAAISAYDTVFTAALVALAGSVVVGLVLPGRRRALALQAERSAEREQMLAAGTVRGDDRPTAVEH